VPVYWLGERGRAGRRNREALSTVAVELGARAVMIGRAYLWGLAANGQTGVENVLDMLRAGIDSTLLALGCSSVHELTAHDLVIPDGFARSLGSSAQIAPRA
jgi:hypothetical protein